MFLIKFEGETKLNLLKSIEEYYIFTEIGESFPKVLNLLVDGKVSIFFWILFICGIVVIITTTLMLRKIKKIKKIFNGTKSEWKKLDEEIKRGVQDNVLGYLIIGILLILFSPIFFSELGILVMQIVFYILIPTGALFILGGLILWNIVSWIKNIKKIGLEIENLQKRALKKENRMEQKTEITLKKEDKDD